MKNQGPKKSFLFESFRKDLRISTNKNKLASSSGKFVKRSSNPALENESPPNGPFAFLADSGLEQILPFLNVRHVQEGEVLWCQDDPCDFMVFVDRGKIKITKHAEFEVNQVVIGVIGKGALAGDFSMLENHRFSTTGTAMEYSLVGLLSKEKFQEILSDSPAIGIELLKEMLSSTSLQLRQSLSRLIHLF